MNEILSPTGCPRARHVGATRDRLATAWVVGAALLGANRVPQDRYESSARISSTRFDPEAVMSGHGADPTTTSVI